MEQQYYGYGAEFNPNGKGMFYPAYMSLEDLQDFAYTFMKQLLGSIVYAEAKAAKIDGGLGLAWEIHEFSEDPDSKKEVWLSRKYSFSMEASWKISMLKDHWLSGGYAPRCQDMDHGLTELQKATTKLQEALKAKYYDRSTNPLQNKYLKNSNWTNILSISLRSFGQQPPKKDRGTKRIRDFAKFS